MDERVIKARELRSRYQFAAVAEMLPDGWEANTTAGIRARLHMERGLALWHLGGWTVSAPDFESSMSLLSCVDDAEDACWIVQTYAYLQGQKMNHETAIHLLAGALERYRPTGVLLGFMQWNLGEQLWHHGKYTDGLTLIEQALQTLLEAHSGDAFCVGVSLAHLYLQGGMAREARRALARVESMLLLRKDAYGARFHLYKAQSLSNAESIPWLIAAYSLAYSLDDKALCRDIEGVKAEVLTAAARHPLVSQEAAQTLAEFAIDHSVGARDGSVLREAIRVMSR